MTLPVLLTNPKQQNPTRFWLRVLFKGVGLYVVCNVLFAVLNPMPTLEQWSVYGHGVPRVGRFPQHMSGLPLLFETHTVSVPKSDTEYRVLMLGDSAIYGHRLELDQTLVAWVNDQHIQLPDGRIVRAYNLAFPYSSFVRDLLLLDYAMRFEPDMVVWALSPHALLTSEIFVSPLVTENPQAMRDLIARYDLAIDPNAEEFKDEPPQLVKDTLWGNRAALYSYIRLQLNGIVWGITHQDNFWSQNFTLVQNDFDSEFVSAIENLLGIDGPQQFSDDMLRFDLMGAALSQFEDQIPILVINEPIFISDGQNSDLYYDSFYPRWFYDAYRRQLIDFVGQYDVFWLDLWDIVPGYMFTNSPLHYSLEGNAIMVEQVSAAIKTIVNGDPLPTQRN